MKGIVIFRKQLLPIKGGTGVRVKSSVVDPMQGSSSISGHDQ